ncbi:hypothetical protein Slin15195_G100560 [Septoria linicola]|uniref:Uncharacterized protein n=1 Tax=Septoria linicola TaxID=215465 RepID=A0A9Q9AVN0_9PEZI|nr:hypothetical protein Slin15195_G100560 [Septoria linicola]
MALFLLWSQAINETYIEYPLSFEAEDKGEAPDLIDWQATVVLYVKKCKIDLAQQSVAGLDDVLDSIRIRPLIGNAKVEKWKWTELDKLRDGDRYDLLTWSREERAKHAFDKKHPLAEFTDEQIASGDIDLP